MGLTVRWQAGGLKLCIDGASRYMRGTCEVNPGALAHDLLEHQNGVAAIGSSEEELQGSGAAWFIRGCPAKFAPHDFDTLVSDLELSMRQLLKRGTPILHCRAIVPPHESEAFDVLIRALATACAALGPHAVDRYLAARAHVACGYWTAVERWHGDRRAGNRQLEAISVEAVHCVDAMVNGRLPEGARLVLTYGDGHAAIVAVYS